MKLLWLDLETTGLDPRECAVLEIAVMQADLAVPFVTTPLYHAVVQFPPYQPLSPFILDMHTKNGLLAECAASGAVSVEEADGALSALVPQETSRLDFPVLAGSSIHFDHGFVRQHLPNFAKRLSHQHYDVSSIKLFCKSLGMPPLPRAEAHRAQADILESIDHARQCAEWVRKEK